MSRGMKWTPFYKAPSHTIANEGLVVMDGRGTMRRAVFEDETFKTLAGEAIAGVHLYANDEAVCQVIDEVEAEYAQRENTDVTSH